MGQWVKNHCHEDGHIGFHRYQPIRFYSHVRKVESSHLNLMAKQKYVVLFNGLCHVLPPFPGILGPTPRRPGVTCSSRKFQVRTKVEMALGHLSCPSGHALCPIYIDHIYEHIS